MGLITLVEDADTLTEMAKSVSGSSWIIIDAIAWPGFRRAEESELLILLGIATQREEAWLFDSRTSVMQDAMIEGGTLMRVLEGPTQKVMFDCRELSDALFSCYKLELSEVLDLQLAHVLRTNFRNNYEIDRFMGAAAKVTQFRGIIRDQSGDERQFFPGEHHFSSPLADETLDIMARRLWRLHSLYEEWMGSYGDDAKCAKRLREGSNVYSAFHHDKPDRRRDSYFEVNDFLPSRVIPAISNQGKVQSWGQLTTSELCSKCRRRFPPTFFGTGGTASKPARLAAPMCPVCRAIDETRQFLGPVSSSGGSDLCQ